MCLILMDCFEKVPRKKLAWDSLEVSSGNMKAFSENSYSYISYS